MNRNACSRLAAVAALLAAGTADAQDKPPKKLYRWVDKDGKVQFGDALPPEAVEPGAHGIQRQAAAARPATVDRALTAEERAAAWPPPRPQAAEAAARSRSSSAPGRGR